MESHDDEMYGFVYLFVKTRIFYLEITFEVKISVSKGFLAADDHDVFVEESRVMVQGF